MTLLNAAVHAHTALAGLTLQDSYVQLDTVITSLVFTYIKVDTKCDDDNMNDLEAYRLLQAVPGNRLTQCY